MKIIISTVKTESTGKLYIKTKTKTKKLNLVKYNDTVHCNCTLFIFDHIYDHQLHNTWVFFVLVLWWKIKLPFIILIYSKSQQNERNTDKKCWTTRKGMWIDILGFFPQETKQKTLSQRDRCCILL